MYHFLLAIVYEESKLSNPLVGGADEKETNQIFIAGVQTNDFRETFGRYNTNSILKTFEEITNDIPIYQRSLVTGMVPPIERLEKAPYSPCGGEGVIRI